MTQDFEPDSRFALERDLAEVIRFHGGHLTVCDAMRLYLGWMERIVHGRSR